MGTTPFKVTADGLIKAVTAIAKERPFFVYSDIGGAEGEGCIMGQALVSLGMSKESLVEWENTRHEAGFDSSIRSLLDDPDMIRKEGLDWEPVSDALRSVQRKQDQGTTWADAVSWL